MEGCNYAATTKVGRRLSVLDDDVVCFTHGCTDLKGRNDLTDQCGCIEIEVNDP